MPELPRMISVPASKVAAPIQPIATAAAPDDSNEIVILKAALARYKDNLSGRTISPQAASAAMSAWSQVCTILTTQLDNDVFGTVWSFFKDNADGVVRETTALTGLDVNVRDKKTKMQLLMIYNGFRGFSQKYSPVIGNDEFLSIVPVPGLYRRLKNAR